MLFGQQGPPPFPPQQPYPQQQGAPGPYAGQNMPGQIQQDPQDQPGPAVARLSVINGDASVRRGDSGDWEAAVINAPLLAGDSVSVAPNGRAELQLDNGDFVRIAGDSEIRIGDLENGRTQIQIAKGLITWHSLRDTNMQSEISTPAVAVHPLRLAEVRVEIGPDGSTKITVRHGDVEVASPRGTERVHEGSMMMVRGSADDPEYQIVNAPVRDGWDGWNDERDAYLSRSQSDRYLNPDMTGTQDLDPYGRWGYDPNYGNVWTPNVPQGWAPYSNGQWVWEDDYGWTWVDYDPWGWAPFHYGSWYVRPGFGWTWFPGPRYGRLWWRPAMVGFFGFGGAGVGVGFGFGNVGWIALAPFEVFHPWYGPGWFAGGGARYGFANNVVHNVNIGNFYRNAGVIGAARAVTAEDFQRGAFRNQIAVNRAQLQQASLVRGAVPMTPTANNLRFGERAASAATPRGQIGNQRFFSRMTPASGGFAARRTPFTQQQAAVRSAFAGGAGGANGGFGGQTSAPSAGSSGGSGWERFGEPSRMANPGAADPRGSGGGSWDRFGTPQAQPRYTAPQQQHSFAEPGSGRYAAPNYGGFRSLQVSPPIVQSRPSAPSGGSYRGGGGAGRTGGSSGRGRR